MIGRPTCCMAGQKDIYRGWSRLQAKLRRQKHHVVFLAGAWTASGQ